MRTIVLVNDRMQTGYRYRLSAPTGGGFDPAFKPELTPREMLELGVFCGKYMTDCRGEFPASWFKRARLASSQRDRSLNYFGVEASQPLSEWRRKGWIHPDDPRGWFQGLAATIWAAACRTRTGDRSDAGTPSAATPRRSGRIANRAISPAGHGSGRPCCSGPTTVARCRPIFGSRQTPPRQGLQVIKVWHRAGFIAAAAGEA